MTRPLYPRGHPLSAAALACLELLVSQGTNESYGDEITEWSTFVALLDRAGFEITSTGIKPR